MLRILVVDNFTPHFPDIRNYADEVHFSDITNPSDGVVYPKIHLLNDNWKRYFQGRLNEAVDHQVRVNSIFLRQSPEGIPVPNQAHNDASMGEYSLMLYLNLSKQCQGGTSLLKHIPTGLEAPTEAQLAEMQKDSNDPTKWEQTYLCPMRPNRAFIFDANLLHRAEPVGGFGSTNKDSRVVLTAFFSKDKT